MSKANILVDKILTQPVWMKWVSTIPTSVVEHCLRSPDWHWWINLLEIDWNFNLSLMTFSINLLIILSKMMSQKALGESYDFLLGLGIMMDIETLKCDGQWPNLIYVLAISMSFLRHATSLTHLLRCLQNNLSGPGVDELLHFVIVLVSSSSKNGPYFVTCLLGISFSKSELTWQCWAALNNRWRVCYNFEFDT